jgi:hypothetical protein
LEKYLKELSKLLSGYDWFYMRNEFTLENVVKALLNKLIERNPNNHTIIFNILIDVLSKVKLDSDLTYWMVSQLEDELDGTNAEIISNSCKLVNALGIETYSIDTSMLNLLSNQTALQSVYITRIYLNKMCPILSSILKLYIDVRMSLNTL